MPKYDNVNHPEHYISGTGIEVIDVIHSFIQGLDGIKAYCAGNVIKYICRWNHKNGLEDLQKARWYLNYLIDILEAEERANDTEVYSGKEGCQIPEMYGKKCLHPEARMCDWCERMDELDLIRESIKTAREALQKKIDKLKVSEDFWQEGDDGK